MNVVAARSLQLQLVALALRAMGALALLISISLALHQEAIAQEIPRLIANNESPIAGWCGSQAVYFSKPIEGQADQSAEGEILRPSSRLEFLDVINKRQLSLQFDPSLAAHLLACSPDSRWIVTENFRPTLAHEGGDPSCDPAGAVSPPTLVLWDTTSGKRHVVGSGVADFQWSPDNAILLYRYWPYCDLERDRRNAFRLPSSVKDFDSVPVAKLIRRVLKPSSGRPSPGRLGTDRIGAMSWYAPDQFVVQVPENEGNRLDGVARHGAIISVHYQRGRNPELAQLNPTGFKTSWVLSIPQLSAPTSVEIIEKALCNLTPTGLSCLDRDNRMVASRGLKPDLTDYCSKLMAGDIAAFCKGDSSDDLWVLERRGSVTLVEKPRRDPNGKGFYYDLFRIENDGGLLR